jgi:hypothetical protein
LLPAGARAEQAFSCFSAQNHVLVYCVLNIPVTNPQHLVLVIKFCFNWLAEQTPANSSHLTRTFS